MTPERWQKIKILLSGALELEPGNRESYLQRSCDGDEGLRNEIEALLDHEQEVSSEFLGQTALAEFTTALLPYPDNPWINRRVGAYKTIEQIGVGGMGEVYRAFRADDLFRKEVALKVVRAGQDSGFILQRFKNERQILANLEHPNIARLLDGGTTEEGTPYIVMELIEGQPILEYSDAHRLPIPDRLALFIEVCAAVQYAHQRLIIHRDIKPGNILVTKDGVPKLLDFGIAKILDVESGSSAGDRTLTMFRLLTPQYASPEQVRGEPITTASDVYSLGVVLYEVLSGRSPYPKTSDASQLARYVCDLEPPKPSATARNGIAHESAINGESELQFVQRVKAARQLKGDLDIIVLKALRKEPQRRYSSVEQLAEDIRRHLHNLPVAARKDTARYRISKFVKRHKAGVTAVIAIAVTLILGFAIALQQARIARRRFNDVRSLANSLIFDVHDSIKDLPGSTPAKKVIVDRALQYLNVLAQESSGDLGLQRELAAAYVRLGAVQGDYLEANLGDNQGTLASYRKALEIRKQIDIGSKNWNDRLALAEGYRLVAHQLWANGDVRSARDQIERAIAISEALNAAQPDNMKILYEMGFDYQTSGTIGYPGDPAARQKILHDYRRALAVDETQLKSNPNDVRTLYGYATDLSDIAKWSEALDARESLRNYQKCVEIDLKLIQLSTDLRYQRSLAIDYGTVAGVYDDLGDYPHALENNLKDLAIYQDLVKKDPKNQLMLRGVAISSANTAVSYAKTGQLKLALDYSKRSLEIMQDLISAAPQKGYGSRIFATMLVYRGTILTEANQPEAGMAEIEQGRSIYESLYKAGAGDQTNVAGADVELAEAAFSAGHEETAAEYFHEALNIAGPLIAKNNLEAIYAAADAHSGLGDLSAKNARQRGQSVQARRAHWIEAQSQYQQSLDDWHRLEHPNHSSPINGFQVGDPALVAKKLKLARTELLATH